MVNPHQETHPNPNEIFPLKGTLGTPGDTAKGAALLGNLLAAAAALALAAAAFFFPYADCTPLFIDATSARFEAEVFNLDPEEEVFWYLVPGKAPDQLPENLDAEDLTRMEQTAEKLTLTDLQSGTEYTIVFVTQDESGNDLLHTFTFRTSDGEEPPPENTPDPPAVPSTPSEDPPPPADDDPAEDQEKEDEKEEEQPEDKETPPVILPPTTGGGGEENDNQDGETGEDEGSKEEDKGEDSTTESTPSLPQGPSEFPMEQAGSPHSLNYEILADGSIAELTFTVNEITQRSVPLYITGLTVDVNGVTMDHNTLGILDSQFPIEVAGSSYTFDPFYLGISSDDIPNYNPTDKWVSVTLQVDGYSAETTEDLKDSSKHFTTTTMHWQNIPINGATVGSVTLDTILPVGEFNGYTCTYAELESDNDVDSERLDNIVEGEEVCLVIELTRTGSQYPQNFIMTPVIEKNFDDSYITDNGEDTIEAAFSYNYLFYTFKMPPNAGNISLKLLDFICVDSMQLFSSPIEEPEPVKPEAPPAVTQFIPSWDPGSNTLQGTLTIADSNIGEVPDQLTDVTVTIISPEYMDVTQYTAIGAPQSGSGTLSFPLSLDLNHVTFREVVGGGLPSKITLNIQANGQACNSQTGTYSPTQTSLIQTCSLS